MTDASGALEVHLLTGERILAAPAIRRPTRIRLVGNHLWIKDAAGDPWIHRVEVSGDFISAHGRRGDAPGEFLNVMHFGPMLEFPNQLWIHDAAQHRVSIHDETTFEVLDIIEIDPSVRVSRLVPIDETTWVGLGSSGDSTQIAMFDGVGELLDVQPGPLLGPASAPLRERLRASSGLVSLCQMPGLGGGFAMAFGSAGRIERYAGRLDDGETMAVPFPSEPTFEPGDGGDLVHRHQRTWYIDCVSTAAGMWALFSGRTAEHFGIPAMDSGQFIHVFDASGELRWLFRLDQAVRSIVIGPEEEWVYAVVAETGEVYRFALPDGINDE